MKPIGVVLNPEDAERFELEQELENLIALSYKLATDKKDNAWDELLKCHAKMDVVNNKLNRDYSIRYTLTKGSEFNKGY